MRSFSFIASAFSLLQLFFAADGFECKYRSPFTQSAFNEPNNEFAFSIWCDEAMKLDQYSSKMDPDSYVYSVDTTPADSGFLYTITNTLTNTGFHLNTPGIYPFNIVFKDVRGLAYVLEPRVDFCDQLSCVDYKPSTIVNWYGHNTRPGKKLEVHILSKFDVIDEEFSKNPLPITVHCTWAYTRAANGLVVNGDEACRWFHTKMRGLVWDSDKQVSNLFSWTPTESEIGRRVGGCFTFTESEGVYKPQYSLGNGGVLEGDSPKTVCLDIEVKGDQSTTTTEEPTTPTEEPTTTTTTTEEPTTTTTTTEEPTTTTTTTTMSTTTTTTAEPTTVTTTSTAEPTTTTTASEESTRTTTTTTTEGFTTSTSTVSPTDLRTDAPALETTDNPGGAGNQFQSTTLLTYFLAVCAALLQSQ